LHYPVVIHYLFSSPAHNYFTRPKFEKGNAPVIHHRELSLEASKGIAGDRFEQGLYPITFFSLEVAELMEKELGKSVDISDFRRNIIVTGINLCELIGHRFSIGAVTFEGIAHCNPCPWMNAVIGKGAYAVMKGRGGLRARVIGGGKLGLGRQQLQCDISLVKTPITALTQRRIP
jgi:hypothetical protein